MENGKISVAVIGGGETGTQLLSQLVNLDFVTVTGVSDLHEIAPGMKLAQRHGIGTTRDFMDLVENCENLDVVVDVTGEKHVRKSLRAHLERVGNQHTTIMSEVVARLLTSVGAGRLVDQKHAYQGH